MLPEDIHSDEEAGSEGQQGLPGSARAKEVIKAIDLNHVVAEGVELCQLLVLWLSLTAGVSRNTANIVLVTLKMIITTILHLLVIALAATGVNISLPAINLPSDVRTLYTKFSLEPTLQHYPLTGLLPQYCTWKRSLRARPNQRLVPHCLYMTQSFKAWLKFFLSSPPDERMHGIHDSPAWESLRAFLHSSFHLIFGMYINWFNPFTNKIAGKVISCGAIVLYCLNLPLEIQFLPENVFVLGMMPAPSSLTIWTISHILSSAIRKVAGFASHAASYFCSFCKCLKENIEDLAHDSWWRDAQTVKAKEEIRKATGVRWMVLHNPPYWNPIDHVTLGYMHNFLEGVLQYQLRILWGIGHSKQALKKLMELDDDTTGHESSASGSEDIPQNPSFASHYPNFDVSSSDSDTPIASLSHNSDEDDMGVNDATFDIPVGFDFTLAELSSIQACIQNIYLPSWVQRPPGNLGNASHGKLKAHELLVLFIAILPLILLEIWSTSGELDVHLL
ncbi:hypothetical protein BDN71DRAFT_1485180 [Pleurotus eryngii]|uniref:Uncharacterized protein n=1 Tax=Pleurotus eryngii TaxID=5323 RepID=A0A9P6D1Z1_PLEER|nr:hypothetical protein BDN71DRAFT_1485180 [Pleurotus eryngii]